MGWFSRKKNNLPKKKEEVNYEVPEISIDESNVLFNSKEDIEFEEKLLQKQFERDYAMNKLQAGVAIAQQGLQTVDRVVDVWKYSKMVEQNIAQIQGATTIELAKISAKFQTQQTALMGIFGHRQQGLSRQFDVLEKAMQENDRDLIIESLRGISTIVTSSPLEDFEKLSKAWDDKSKPLELDF